MATEYTSLEDWHVYSNNYLADITDNKSDMLTHVNSEFLFYNFNKYRNLISEEAYKVKHTIIAGNNYPLEKMQSKNWPFFVERLIKISEGNITALDFGGTKNDFNPTRVGLFGGQIDSGRGAGVHWTLPLPFLYFFCSIVTKLCTKIFQTVLHKMTTTFLARYHNFC